LPRRTAKPGEAEKIRKHWILAVDENGVLDQDLSMGSSVDSIGKILVQAVKIAGIMSEDGIQEWWIVCELTAYDQTGQMGYGS
jgi:hypothetical protein